MNTNPPNLEMDSSFFIKKERKEKKLSSLPRLKDFTIQLQSSVAELPERMFIEKFKNLDEAVDHCRANYKHWLFCAVNGKLVVDNIRAFRQNENNFPNYIKLKNETKASN